MLTENSKIQDIISSLEDLQAINQKSELKNVIGSSSDTTMGQIIELNNAKNKIANSLKTKNIEASTDDSFTKLAQDVESISIKNMGGFGTGDEIGLENLNLFNIPFEDVNFPYSVSTIKSVHIDEKERMIISCEVGSYSYLFKFAREIDSFGIPTWKYISHLQSTDRSWYGGFISLPNSDFIFIIVGSRSIAKINKDTLLEEAGASFIVAHMIEDMVFFDESTLVAAGTSSAGSGNLSLTKIRISDMGIISKKDSLPSFNFSLRFIGNRYCYTCDFNYGYIIDLADYSYKLQSDLSYVKNLKANSSNIYGTYGFVDGDSWYVFYNVPSPAVTYKYDINTLQTIWQTTDISKGITDYNETHFMAYSHKGTSWAGALVDKNTREIKGFPYKASYPSYLRYDRVSKQIFGYESGSAIKLQIPLTKFKVR